MLKKFNIDPKRIFYVPNTKGYFRECTKSVSDFVALYQVCSYSCGTQWACGGTRVGRADSLLGRVEGLLCVA